MLSEVLREQLYERLTTGADAATPNDATQALDLFTHVLGQVQLAVQDQAPTVTLTTPHAWAVTLWLAGSLGLELRAPDA